MLEEVLGGGAREGGRRRPGAGRRRETAARPGVSPHPPYPGARRPQGQERPRRYPWGLSLRTGPGPLAVLAGQAGPAGPAPGLLAGSAGPNLQSGGPPQLYPAAS